MYVYIYIYKGGGGKGEGRTTGGMRTLTTPGAGSEATEGRRAARTPNTYDVEWIITPQQKAKTKQKTHECSANLTNNCCHVVFGTSGVFVIIFGKYRIRIGPPGTCL